MHKTKARLALMTMMLTGGWLSTACHTSFAKLDACAERGQHCQNGIMDCDESDVDCGGTCGVCVKADPCAGHCDNGVVDCGEAGLDCGGGCRSCAPPAACAEHCGNGAQDCGETGLDCGGECTACPVADPCASHCGNGAEDCGETGLDCGGGCAPCPLASACVGHCGNGTQDCGETGLDCGGECTACPAGRPMLRGVSLAGADFSETTLPGTYGTTYTYPTTAEVDHFVALGMNVFRLPFRWERLQRQQLAALDAPELSRIDQFVSYATAKGAYVLLDPHNYARYYNAVIGAGVPVQAFADFWSKLAAHFKSNAHVLFGIMNEPNTMSTDVWLADANAAIAAIRATGATNLITVPGNAWTGAHSWLGNWYGTSNAQALLGITDPFDNFVIEVHQYLDPDSSGGNMGSCPSATAGSERLAAFNGWLEQHGLRAFLGEFGAGESQACLTALDDLVAYMEGRPDQWIGWAYWAAGPWWGNSVGNIEPVNGQDRAQMTVLRKFIPSP
jgi:endoglucanase